MDLWLGKIKEAFQWVRLLGTFQLLIYIGICVFNSIIQFKIFTGLIGPDTAAVLIFLGLPGILFDASPLIKGLVWF